MAEKDHAEIWCEAMDIIVSKKLEGINFDKTINCTIIDAKNASFGEYKVTDGSAKFYAYSASTSYKEDDAVYVTVPNGDFNNQKIIIGKQVTNNTSPFIFTTPFDTMVDVSTNLINDKVTSGYLRANYPKETEILLWEKDFEANKQSLAGYTRLGIQGQFRSWLDSFKCIDGNYGYKLVLHCKEEVVKTEENIYDLAIKTLTDIDNITPEIISYLENTLGLIINWEKYHLEEGGINIALLLQDLNIQRAELSYVKYELFLSSKGDMYGNPYNFESFYQQEKVFDISTIKEIQKMQLYFYQEPTSFIDRNMKQVPYMDEFEGDLLPNLFTKDSYICLGYDITEFDDNQATLYCLDSNTYSNSYLLEEKANQKNIILRWIHKFEDGRTKTITSDTNLKYEVRWYRYKLGAPSADEYSGVYWERLTDGTGFYYILNPDIHAEMEQIKAIILFEDKVIRSNILTFRNENKVIDAPTSDYLSGLNIWCKDNTYGNYYIYDPGNKILEQYDIKQARELVALFSVQSNLMTSEQDGSILTEATSITWTFPTVSTMLTVYGINYSIPYPNKENCQFMVCGPNEIASITPDMCVIENDTLQTITYKIDKTTYVYNHILKTISITREGDINNANAIDATQLYLLKKDYIQSYANNTIQCSIIKDHIEYFTSKTFYFGQAGTTGTDVTLKLYIDPADTFALTKKQGGDTLHIKALLFDSHNREIDPNNETIYQDVTYEWSWFAYKYNDNDETNRYVSTKIKPYVGSSSEVTDKNFVQIIKNKKWVQDEEDLNKYYFIDAEEEHYSNKAKNEIIIETDDNLTMDHFLILQCTVKGWGDYDLIAYKPIAIRLGNKYSYVDCANEVIYLTSGYPEYYKEAWKIHLEDIDEDNDGYEDEYTDGYWKIFNPYEENTFYIGSIKDNVLIPVGIYMEDVNQYGAQYVATGGDKEAIKILDSIDRKESIISKDIQEKIEKLTELTIPWSDSKYILNEIKDENNTVIATYYNIDKIIEYINNNSKNPQTIVWTQPIVCVTNNYPSGTLNKWPGKEIQIDKENGYILAPAIAAGKKNPDNTFSGVMIGDWSSTGNGENAAISGQTGVYGLNKGMLSYALMEDGTAFFGKSGRGRIILDGDKSTITNEGYRKGLAGMKIDLDDAFIDIKDNSKTRVFISKDGTTLNPFFEIKGNTQSLIHISNSNYYLQTDDYKKDSSGVRIDLKQGKINAYNFTIDAKGSEEGEILIRSSDGFIKSTWGNIGGFTITDHSIFAGATADDSTLANAKRITASSAWTYWGASSANASTYDFRLGNSFFYNGAFGDYGRLIIASNIYSLKRNNSKTLLSESELTKTSYFLIGINNVNDSDEDNPSEIKDRLQIGTATAAEAGYNGISMYGNGGTIYLIPGGSTINDSRLKVSSNEVMMSFKKDNVRKSAAFYLTDEVFELNFSKKSTRKSLYVSNNTFKVDLFSTGSNKRGVLYMTGNTFKITFKESKTNGEFYLTENVLRVDMEPENQFGIYARFA